MKPCSAFGARCLGPGIVLVLVVVLDARGQDAAEILKASGVKGGLLVHLGCGDGRLTAALRTSESYLVHGLDADARNVEAARKHIQSLGFYGPVSVDRFDGRRLPYAENLVNLVVADRLDSVPMDEVMRALAPGGVALIGGSRTAKPWPKEMGEWTHYLGDASGNAVARDTLVGPPRRLQWADGPLWARHHELNTSVMALVSAKGRVFYICDEAPATIAGLPDQWALVARDAFNGVLLWRRPMPDWGWKAWSTREPGGRFNVPLHAARRLAAVGDRVYVTLGFNAPLTALDAATGETVTTYKGTEFTDEVLWHDGLLILSVNKGPQGPGRMAEKPPVRKQVMALRADTGEVLWRRGDYGGIASKSDVFERITHLSLVAGGGRAFLLEEDAVVCLDLATGRELWRTPRPEKKMKQGHIAYNPPNLATLVACGEVLLFAQPEEPYTRETWNRAVRVRLAGLDAATGKELWSRLCGKWGPGVEADVFVIGGLVWTHAPDAFAAIALDPRTGETKRTLSTKAAFDEVHHHRCYRNRATDRYILTGRRGIEFIPLDGQPPLTNHWVRGSCRFGIVPANGLVYVPPHPCQCYITTKLSGFFALAPETGSKVESPKSKVADERRLEKGPAYSEIGNRKSEIGNAPDWPTYRGDARRSGTTQAAVPARLQPLWQTLLGGRISACTIADGRVYTAAVDEHRVCALDAKDGRIVWTFTAGGRVDTPPTLHRGLALFGSADGWLYALRASDGALAWRFRAAPHDARIVAFGRLESPWPLHGAVLIHDGLAYVAAGRSTHLDGGIKVYAIEPATGKVVRELRPLNSDPHGLDDVLVSDGRLVFMRHLAFSLGGEAPKPPEKGKGKGKGRALAAAPRAYSTAGLLDPTCFSRVGWTLGGGAGDAHLLAFNEQAAYRFQTRRTGGFGGWFEAAKGAYELAARDRRAAKPLWTKPIPVRVRALIEAGGVIFAAGAPDAVDPKDPWAAVEGRAGGVLWALSAADGAKLTEYRLDAPPVWDGLAAAAGRLYVSTADGKVACFAGKE